MSLSKNSTVENGHDNHKSNGHAEEGKTNGHVNGHHQKAKRENDNHKANGHAKAKTAPKYTSWKESRGWQWFSFLLLGLYMSIWFAVNLFFMRMGHDILSYVPTAVSHELQIVTLRAGIRWLTPTFLLFLINNLLFAIVQQILIRTTRPPSSLELAYSFPPWKGFSKEPILALFGRFFGRGFEVLSGNLAPFLVALQVSWIIHLLLLSPSEARQAMTVIDSSLGRPLPEKDYGNHCDRMDTFFDSLYDFFVFVHFFGFFLMAGALRSFFVTFLISIFDEILEFSLQHIFPNFRECWWDHFLLDVFGANLLGCLCGFLLARAFHLQSTSWTSPRTFSLTSSAPEGAHKASPVLPPKFFTKVKKMLFGPDKRPLIFALFVFIHRIVCFVLPFAFKYVMWVPVPHLLFVYHGIAQFTLQGRSYIEHYQHYLRTLSGSKEWTGPWQYLWRSSTVFILALETALIIKMLLLAYNNLMPPMWILWMWCGIVAFIGFCLLYKPHNKKKLA